MKISLQKSSFKNIRDHTLIVPVYQQGSKMVLPKEAAHLKNLLEKLRKDNAFKGELRQSVLLRYVPISHGQNILFVGFGEKGKLKIASLREALIHAAAELSQAKTPRFTFHLGTVDLAPAISDLVQICAESLALPTYRFTKFKTEKKPDGFTKEITLCVLTNAELAEGKKGLDKANILIEACNLVRDLVNTPSNGLRPPQYADLAQDIGKKAGLKVKIFHEKELEKEGFGALLAVNRGSQEPARFVVLEHNAGKKELDTICLVGKGITFDSGGISLKPSESMETMKCDMAGSATVLGLMQIVSKLNLPLHVVGFMPLTDNMPSGKATVPGDIVKSYSGKTIEILNTDAEGRLILADALAYADKNYHPKLIIDFATLTGACVIALGEAGAGMMGTDQKSMDRLKELAELSGDKIWQLPLWDEYREEFKSPIADIRNIGQTRGAGSSKGGLFLQTFISDKTPWVHFDIAGPAFISKATHRYYPKGATAACVRLMSEFLIDRANRKILNF
jgi:leucyl aminopeptidase